MDKFDTVLEKYVIGGPVTFGWREWIWQWMFHVRIGCWSWSHERRRCIRPSHWATNYFDTVNQPWNWTACITLWDPQRTQNWAYPSPTIPVCCKIGILREYSQYFSELLQLWRPKRLEWNTPDRCKAIIRLACCQLCTFDENLLPS